MTQSETLCTNSGEGTWNSIRGFIFPTVTQTGQGHMALGASFASSTEWAGRAVAGRLRTDAAGTIQARDHRATGTGLLYPRRDSGADPQPLG